MTKYVIKRVLLMFLTLFLIMTICFVLIKLLPLPAIKEMGRDVQLVLARREKMGYDKPIMVQYYLFLKNLLTGWDWGVGEQMYTGRDVWAVMMQKLPYTVLVNLYSILIAIPLGLGFGIYAALRKNKWQDQIINVIIILLISVPAIVLALMIQYVFCFKLGWFPLTMSTSKDYFSGPVFHSMLPAVFALCLGSIASYARYTRAELSEVLTGEFMLLARTKGLTKRQAIFRHAMRNSMVAIFPSILSEFVSVLSGSLIIEKMFGINGVGGLYLNSITFQDYDFFMLLSGFYTLVSLTAGIVIDISYGFIDPRIRMGAK